MAASLIIAQTPQSNVVKTIGFGHQRRGLGLRALPVTITGLGVTGSVAIAAAGGTRRRNCWRIRRSFSSATVFFR
jgi:hypothetical protein